MMAIYAGKTSMFTRISGNMREERTFQDDLKRFGYTLENAR